MKSHKPGHGQKKAEVKGNKSQQQIQLPNYIQQPGQKGELLSNRLRRRGKKWEEQQSVLYTAGNKEQNGRARTGLMSPTLQEISVA